jgi:hypothetical protein
VSLTAFFDLSGVACSPAQMVLQLWVFFWLMLHLGVEGWVFLGFGGFNGWSPFD